MGGGGLKGGVTKKWHFFSSFIEAPFSYIYIYIDDFSVSRPQKYYFYNAFGHNGGRTPYFRVFVNLKSFETIKMHKSGPHP